MALIANMIGRNEANRFLRPVLENIREYVDAIVFTDDCSDDETLEIAKEFEAFTYKTDEPMFSVHEGILRQQSWENLSNHAARGDWVLAIDCDEKLFVTPGPSLKEMMGNRRIGVINVQFAHMWSETHYRVDKAWAPHPSTRLFRYQENGRFLNRKMAPGSEPTYVQDFVRKNMYMRKSPLIMQHLGYVRDEDKKAKLARYLELDGGNFHSRRHIESIADPHPILKEWVLG